MNSSSSAKKAVIDTSVLLCLYYLDLVHLLSFFYHEVRIPREVEKEFLYKPSSEIEKSKRYAFLTEFYEKNNSWFLPCNDYGTDIVEIYLTEEKLDRGEAEVFAQNQSLGGIFDLLLDEREGRKVASSNSIKHHGFLFILANLELRFKACNYFEGIASLKKQRIGKFSTSIVNYVYEEENKKLGIS